MKKVQLYEIDRDYLKLIRSRNKVGKLFRPMVMGTAGWNSLTRLKAAGKIEYVDRKMIGGYQVVGNKKERTRCSK